ncbi:uncharacterized protein HD556DRAFT_1437632 [Suillus plorans]|uniref:DUF6534 domain-containing protein n=1 Tax=Suillus plorans TaxID=116603 RepID=A0A9P7DV60_9AGAM|nr:uncharacterized protein HD556DRAFT_1437632 [Suillus plorans]KAG1803896.1 hypothetical protein HD556DRAFT_1437632 [Suillus plorans]
MNDTLSVLTSHFIGVIISSMFYGFALAQTWWYFRTYPKDRWSMKALVAFLWLNTAQLALVAASIYHYAIVWQGDIAMSSHISKTFEASMGITSIIAFLVQLTYVYRIWRLSFGNILVTFFIVLLALVALGSGGAMVVKTIHDPLWDSTHVSNLPASSFYLSSMACDFLIAATQVYLFHKSRTGRGRLGGLISRLTVLVVNVGLITTCHAISHTGTDLDGRGYPTHNLSLSVSRLPPQWCLSRPIHPHESLRPSALPSVTYLSRIAGYLNSFLSVLNSRLELRELADNNEYACPSIYTITSELA